MISAAVILAAGFSSRMGSDKALLKLGGRTAIEQIVGSYQTAGVDRIIVVTGQNHETLGLLNLKVQLARNHSPEQGMFSSIQTGVELLESTVDAFFVHPVDTPLIRPHTLQLLAQVLPQQGDIAAVIPCCDGKRGHPPLLRSSMKGVVGQYHGKDGLRGLLAACRTMLLPVADQGILQGMNTPEQYAALRHYQVNQQG